MIKNLVYKSVLVSCILIVSCISCEKIEELPPKSEQSTLNKAYKIPNPVTLSAEEIAEINSIRQEYNENVTQ